AASVLGSRTVTSSIVAPRSAARRSWPLLRRLRFVAASVGCGSRTDFYRDAELTNHRSHQPASIPSALAQKGREDLPAVGARNGRDEGAELPAGNGSEDGCGYLVEHTHHQESREYLLERATHSEDPRGYRPGAQHPEGDAGQEHRPTEPPRR